MQKERNVQKIHIANSDKPGTDITGEWIIIPGDTKKYHKAIPWNEEQEKIISSILKELGLELY